MNTPTVLAIALVAVAWGLTSERLAARNLSGPLIFLMAGFVLGNSSWGLIDVEVGSTEVHVLAELTLALLLFGDASSVPLGGARHDLPVTLRLLGLALPLTMILGAVLALVMFPSLPVALAGLVAASLAPTDAALSAPVVTDSRLPAHLRRILNVESGLNDGIATPVVTLCIAASASVLGMTSEHEGEAVHVVSELALGAAVGALIAGLGGYLLVIAHRRRWTMDLGVSIVPLALALASYLVAAEMGGNPFVAAFTGGFLFGATARRQASVAVEYTETTGSLLSLVVWFVFGATFLMPALELLDLPTALYAVASLTVIRMLPVLLALMGSGIDRPTGWFISWFGPRGLASVVFALLAVEDLGVDDPRLIVAYDVIAVTIVLSVVAHGLTARPFATRLLRARAASAPG